MQPVRAALLLSRNGEVLWILNAMHAALWEATWKEGADVATCRAGKGSELPNARQEALSARIGDACYHDCLIATYSTLNSCTGRMVCRERLLRLAGCQDDLQEVLRLLMDAAEPQLGGEVRGVLRESARGALRASGAAGLTPPPLDNPILRTERDATREGGLPLPSCQVRAAGGWREAQAQRAGPYAGAQRLRPEVSVGKWAAGRPGSPCRRSPVRSPPAPSRLRRR